MSILTIPVRTLDQTKPICTDWLGLVRIGQEGQIGRSDSDSLIKGMSNESSNIAILGP